MGRQMGSREVDAWGIFLIATTLLFCQCTNEASAGDIPQPNDGGWASWASTLGSLKSAWSLCKKGVRQSPMFITADNMVTDHRLGKLDAKYTSKWVPANSSNDGHEVVVSVPASAGVLNIKNVVYRPVQMHFHMPSEHKILNDT